RRWHRRADPGAQHPFRPCRARPDSRARSGGSPHVVPLPRKLYLPACHPLGNTVRQITYPTLNLSGKASGLRSRGRCSGRRRTQPEYIHMVIDFNPGTNGASRSSQSSATAGKREVTADRPAGTQNTGQPATGDAEVRLSNQAQQLQAIEERLRELPEVDTARVERIK